MFSVSVLKEYPSKTEGSYFYTSRVQVDNGMSFFPRINMYEDGNIKITMPTHVSILSEKIADEMTAALTDAVTKIHEDPNHAQTKDITFGDEKVLSAVESHLTPNKDGSAPSVYENSKINVHASITFDFSDSKGEKAIGIDTTLRSRSDGSGKFIALPSKRGTDGNFYKEVTCSRAISDLLNEKGLSLYSEELNKSKEKEALSGEKEPQKKEKRSAPSR